MKSVGFSKLGNIEKLEQKKTSVEMTEKELEAEKMQLYQEILKLKQEIEVTGED